MLKLSYITLFTDIEPPLVHEWRGCEAIENECETIPSACLCNEFPKKKQRIELVESSILELIAGTCALEGIHWGGILRAPVNHLVSWWSWTEASGKKMDWKATSDAKCNEVNSIAKRKNPFGMTYFINSFIRIANWISTGLTNSWCMKQSPSVDTSKMISWRPEGSPNICALKRMPYTSNEFFIHSSTSNEFTIYLPPNFPSIHLPLIDINIRQRLRVTRWGPGELTLTWGESVLLNAFFARLST